MQNELPQELQDYISAILGMKQPYELSTKDEEESKGSDEDNDRIRMMDDLTLLFQADSLWNLGKSSKSQEILKSYRLAPQHKSSDVIHQSFATGLESLNAGSLTEALTSFRQAASAASASSTNHSPLLTTFFTERAVNIAFWMACSGSMLDAAKLLDDDGKTTTHNSSMIQETPFVGGILSFAYHMSGDSILAESIARKAISSGMEDPWTIHAVAHALTSQDRHAECAEWLILHRSKAEECNPFMKGHMEFHLALSYMYLKDEPKLQDLIHGSLWGSMSEEMKADYWNAAGLLNVLWKAEIRGVITNPLKNEYYSACITEALQKIESVFQGDANAGKSSVFSVCIFRFTRGPTMREKWKKALLDDSVNEVLSNIAKAVSVLYHQHGGSDGDDDDPTTLEPLAIQDAKVLVEVVANKLPELGASPEQRETIDDFVQMIQKA